MRRAVVALVAGLAAGPAVPQSLLPGQVLSSLVVQPLADPAPVLGADGKLHLAYELLMVNPSTLFLTLDKVEVVDPSGNSLSVLEGEALKGMTHIWSGQDLRLDPGGSAAVYLDVTLDPGAALPATMQAEVTATRQVADAKGEPAPLPATAPVPATETFTAAAVTVGRPAVVIEPPLGGGNWLAINGCCAPPTAHRQGLIPVNGRMNAPERFAIDWVQLDADDRLYSGDQARLKNYAYYGASVRSVADGVVVNTCDEANEEVPGQPRSDLTPESIGGNMVVVDIGGGNFAFYAHLQRGSLKVKPGDGSPPARSWGCSATPATATLRTCTST